MDRVIKSEISTRNEINNGITKTVPDQAPSLGSMLKRFQRGLPVDVKRNQPIYNGDVDLPNLKKMDLTEIDEYSRNLKQNIKTQKHEQTEIKKRYVQQKSNRDKKQLQSDTDNKPI